MRLKRGLVCLVAVGVAGLLATGGRATQSAKQIEVLSVWSGAEQDAFMKVAKTFTSKTGIEVKYTTAADLLPTLRTRIAAGDPPDVAFLQRRGTLAELARGGSLVPLTKLGLTARFLQARYSAAWLAFGTVSAKRYGLPVTASSKSLLWYRPQVLRRFRLEPPKTWNQLLAVVRTLKARGVTPWVLGAKDAWTLTDWFENIYIRTAGPAKYDALFSGRRSFADKSVVSALKEMLQMLSDRYLDGGRDGALRTGFVDSVAQVFGRPGHAALYMEGGFVAAIAKAINPALRAGKTIDAVAWPTIAKRWGNPLIGGGYVATVFRDTPEIRSFMRFLASAEAARTWVSTGAVVSPNHVIGLPAYPNALMRREVTQVATARVFRFDGSDLLPGSLADDWGSTLQGVLQDPSKTTSLLNAFQAKAKTQFSHR